LNYTIRPMVRRDGSKCISIDCKDIRAPRSSFISNGGVICGNSEILVKGFIIARKLGVRIVYRKFSAL
jgi:hypothetical protein